MEPRPLEPSALNTRYRAAALTSVGFVLTLMMAAFQLGWISRPWEPFFGDGTMRVLRSPLSRAFPIPDALLGAIVYAADIALLLAGDERRWLGRPWLTLLSGAVSVGLTAIAWILLWSQPTFFHSWCTPCAISAVLLLVSLHLTIAEPLSSARLVFYSILHGRPWREALTRDFADEDPLAIQAARSGQPDWQWSLPVCALVGVFLLVMPSLWSVTPAGAFSLRLAGVLSITGSVLAANPATRALRILNFAAGFLLLSWFAGDCQGADRYLAAFLGLGLSFLAFAGIRSPQAT